MQTQVTIIGAGPVGLTAAMDFAQRGVDVTVVESRSAHEPADAKCNTVAARTMEIFRGLGIADAVRAAGLSDDFPTDVIYSTAVGGEEITRITQPSRNERLTDDGRSAPGYPDSHWLTPEPVVRVSQLYLNPILDAHARTFERITVRSETEFLRYEDTSEGVVAHCRNREGEDFTISSRFLIGSDGASSTVRKQMGVRLTGDAEIANSRSTLVRCKEIKHLFPGRPGWMTWVLNPRQSGTVVAIDGEELWLIHRMVLPGTDIETIDPDQSIREVLGVGPDFSWEVVHHQDWTARRMVASRFRDNNVFVCGDAAHIWIPFAGYGMNAGIADSVNLTWMMAAVIHGHAEPDILAAHERERHPITEQVSQLAMAKAEEHLERSARRNIPKVLEARNFIGRWIRKRIGKQLREINIPQFACEGLNFGYYYDDSPIIAYDRESPPQYGMGDHTPSTVPGCRMPHFWMADGTSLYDALGPDYALLRFDESVDVSEVVEAMEVGDVPIRVLNSAPPADAPWLKHRLILVRPDRHVAWRGDAGPADCSALVRLLRGGDATEIGEAGF